MEALPRIFFLGVDPLFICSGLSNMSSGFTGMPIHWSFTLEEVLCALIETMILRRVTTINRTAIVENVMEEELSWLLQLLHEVH